MESTRPRRRPIMGMIDDLLDKSHGEIKRKAENRENFEAQNLPLGRELMMMIYNL